MVRRVRQELGSHAVRIDDATYELLRRIAEREERSFVSILRQALRQFADADLLKEA